MINCYYCGKVDNCRHHPIPPEGPKCHGCNNEIDLSYCHCGDVEKYHVGDHPFIPMGCDCYRGS